MSKAKPNDQTARSMTMPRPDAATIARLEEAARADHAAAVGKVFLIASLTGYTDDVSYEGADKAGYFSVTLKTPARVKVLPSYDENQGAGVMSGSTRTGTWSWWSRTRTCRVPSVPCGLTGRLTTALPESDKTLRLKIVPESTRKDAGAPTMTRPLTRSEATCQAESPVRPPRMAGLGPPRRQSAGRTPHRREHDRGPCRPGHSTTKTHGAPTMKRPPPRPLTRSEAMEIAERKARYGHREWLVWDLPGGNPGDEPRSRAEPHTAKSMTAALADVGPNGAILVVTKAAHLWRITADRGQSWLDKGKYGP